MLEHDKAQPRSGLQVSSGTTVTFKPSDQPPDFYGFCPAIMQTLSLPIQCNRIDHYTIIVPDAKQVSDFHHTVLGYDFLQLKEVNAGSVPEGEYDMLNYIHEWPDRSGRVLVVTEGLTDTSIFRRYMSKYGQGIHHIALQVDDLELAFATLQAHQVKITSDRILIDVVSGLKQIFIDNSETGVFIELIERSKDEHSTVDATEKGFFTHDNMAGLAGTMSGYLTDIKKVASQTEQNTNTLPRDKIPEVKLSEFVLEVSDPESSAAFFAKHFGFIRSAQQAAGGVSLHLASEPGLRFHCLPRQNPQAQHTLVCQADLAHAQQVLQDHPEFDVQPELVAIAPAIAGYPLRLTNPA